MLLTKVSGGTSRHLLPRIAVHALAPQCTTRGCHVISLRGSSQAPSVRFTSTLNRTCLSLHTTNHSTRLVTSCPFQSTSLPPFNRVTHLHISPSQQAAVTIVTRFWSPGFGGTTGPLRHNVCAHADWHQ